MAEDDKEIETPETDETENAGQDRIVGYILSPDALVALLDICEDLPYRYSKKLVPTLQQSSQLVEGADGNARVVNVKRG